MDWGTIFIAVGGGIYLAVFVLWSRGDDRRQIADLKSIHPRVVVRGRPYLVDFTVEEGELVAVIRAGGRRGKHEIGRIAFPFQPERWDRFGKHGIHYDRPTLQRYARSAVRQLVD